MRDDAEELGVVVATKQAEHLLDTMALTHQALRFRLVHQEVVHDRDHGEDHAFVAMAGK